MSNTLQVPAFVELTPQLLAAAFWRLDDTQQAAFFVALVAEIDKTRADPATRWPGLLGEYGEGQWYGLEKRLAEPQHKEARAMLMALAAPLFLHTLRAAGERW